MQEHDTTNPTVPSQQPKVTVSQGCRWAYKLLDQLSATQREVFDAYLRARGHRFGRVEVAIIEALLEDKTNSQHRAVALLTERFNTVGWPPVAGTRAIHLKFREISKQVAKEALLATLPKERRARYHPTQFISYRHRKPGHA